MRTRVPVLFQPSLLSTLSPQLNQIAQAADALVTGGVESSLQPAVWPAMNIWRNEETVIVEAEIPGFDKQDVELLVTGDSLTIQGKRESESPEGAAALRVESSVTQFKRSITLPAPVDAEGIQATLSQGVLQITLPIAPGARSRRIPISAGDHNALRTASR